MERTPQDIYRAFMEFEERAAAIYVTLACHFNQDAELSSFWLEMALHEKQHAGLLQFCLRDRLFVDDLPQPDVIQHLANLFGHLEADAAEPALSVESAFRVALELETSEINAVYCYLTTALHESMYLLRRKVATLIPDHVEQLVAAARRAGVDEGTIQALLKANEDYSAAWRPGNTDRHQTR
jgi:hypothetical protein